MDETHVPFKWKVSFIHLLPRKLIDELQKRALCHNVQQPENLEVHSETLQGRGGGEGGPEKGRRRQDFFTL